MLDEEKDGPSTSASVGRKLVPVSDPPEPTASLPEGPAGLGTSSGGEPSAVIHSSDESEPDTPLAAEARLSVEAGLPPPAGGNKGPSLLCTFKISLYSVKLTPLVSIYLNNKSNILFLCLSCFFFFCDHTHPRDDERKLLFS